MKIKALKAKIISNRNIKLNYWHLEFESPLIAQAQPGQFVNIRTSPGNQPLLRRPLSIHAVKGKRVRVMYEVLGEGTRALSGRRPAELLDMIGPLGHGFDLPVQKKSRGLHILVAGGMGAAPLLFLAEKLKSRRPLVLIGARNKESLLCIPEFKAMGLTVKAATDDGSAGFKGRVSDLLAAELKESQPAGIFSCGPHPMLKAVAALATDNGINAQLSLEEHMACGIGACLGCVVLTKNGYRRVCNDGPVFAARDLIW